MNEFQAAHGQLLVLGGEVLAVLVLALVAEQPGWGAPVLVLLVILWTLFLFNHAGELRAKLARGASPDLKLQPGTGGQ